MKAIQLSKKKNSGGFLIPTIAFVIIWILLVALWFFLPAEKTTTHIIVLIAFISISMTSLFAYVVMNIHKQLTDSKDEILKNSTIDEITGLPTSKRLMYKYKEISENNKGWCMALVVINHSDNFRALFGFKLYKEHLVKTGNMLTEFVTDKGTVAYLNSGRYSLIFPYIGNAEAVLTSFANTFNSFADSDIFSESTPSNYKRSYSCGTYFFDGTPIAIEMPTAILKSNLYGNEENSVNDFTSKIDTSIKLNRELSPHVSSAFTNNEFKSYYQPKYDAVNNRVIGAELLARWEFDGKIVMPDDFIPVLQNSGNILDLDLFIIKEACEIMSKWVEQKIPPIPLSTNISSYSVSDRNFIERLTSLISNYNLPESLIEVEISQNDLIRPDDSLHVIARKMSSLGFSISIDNVGTQNNAVELVRVLNASSIKFSEEFFLLSEVSETNEKILKASIKFFDALGIVTIAKSIGTKEHFDLAKKCGCTNVQGTFFCPPMSGEEFFKYLVDNDVNEIYGNNSSDNSK